MEEDNVAQQSELINDALESQLKEVLGKLEKKIELRAILGNDEQSREMERFLRHVVSLSSCLSLELYSSQESTCVEVDMNKSMFPVVGIYDENGNYLRTAFYGVPGGKELNTFIMAICYSAGLGKALDDHVEKCIKKFKKKRHIQVFVSLSCHHCAQMGMNCQRLASLNDNIECEIINGILYPEIIKKYNIKRIPLTIIDGNIKILGVKNMEEILGVIG